MGNKLHILNMFMMSKHSEWVEKLVESVFAIVCCLWFDELVLPYFWWWFLTINILAISSAKYSSIFFCVCLWFIISFSMIDVHVYLSYIKLIQCLFFGRLGVENAEGTWNIYKRNHQDCIVPIVMKLSIYLKMGMLESLRYIFVPLFNKDKNY